MISKHFKKLTALLLTTMAPFSISHADSVFDCFYVGGGIGETFTTYRLNSQFTVNAGVLTRASSSQYLHKDTFFGGIFAGYGYSWCQYYLGGEASLKIWNPNASNNSSNTNTRPTVFSNFADNPSVRFNKLEFDLDLRPGFLLSDCSLLYGRVGIAFNKVSLDSNSNALQIFSGVGVPPPLANSLAISNSKSIVGLRLGLGIEQMICDCISLRLDYVGTRFDRIRIEGTQTGSVTFTPVEDPVTIPLTFNGRRDLKVIDHAFMLGLSYYW